MRHLRLIALIVFTLSVLPFWPAAALQSDTIQVHVQRQAALIGESVEVSVRVRCDPFGEHFESNITVSQDDQRIFAQRGLPVVECDGTWHEYTVLATPFEGSFHPGSAFASAFVSRLDPNTSEVRQGQDVGTIRVR